MRNTAVLLALIVILCLSSAATAEAKDRIYADIGIGLNYSIIDQTAFLAPKIGLEFAFTNAIMADFSLGFETVSTDYSGIEKLENRYLTIDLLGKYFVNNNFWIGSGFGYAMFLNSSTANAAPDIAGELHTDLLRFLISAGYLSEILEGINLNPSLLVRVTVPTEESGSFDVSVGLYFVTSLGIVRD